MLLNCFLITLCWVIILDQLKFWEDFSTMVCGWMTKGKIKRPIDIKPFNCSVCMGFWTNLFYIIFTGKFSILIVVFILLLSWSTPILNSILSFLRNAVIKLINTIAEKINI